MEHDEFAIIERYFSNIGNPAGNTVLAVGDDAAVVNVPPADQMVVSMDTGIHFPVETSAADIAYKALAVNLSDLAAMAASPAWFLLSLTLPKNDSDWLDQFAKGLRQAADNFNLQLIGGDTCRGALSIGALSITIQIAGLVPSGRFVSRKHATRGDLILVSGELGNAGLGLAQIQGQVDLPPDLQSRCLLALNRPAHVLKASGCGASISRDAIPVNAWIEQQQAYHYALGAGDDYEICCCVPARHRGEIDNWNLGHPECRLTVIGEVTESGYMLQEGERLIDLTNLQGSVLARG
jgi:thiamine-monophosphate kinase